MEKVGTDQHRKAEASSQPYPTLTGDERLQMLRHPHMRQQSLSCARMAGRGCQFTAGMRWWLCEAMIGQLLSQNKSQIIRGSLLLRATKDCTDISLASTETEAKPGHEVGLEHRSEP